MKLLDQEDSTQDLAAERTFVTFTLAAIPVRVRLFGAIRGEALTGGGYTVRGYAAGESVFESDVLKPAGTVRFDIEMLAKGGEEITLTLQNLSGVAENKTCDAWLGTGVNMVEISDDATASDYLEEFLNGTDGADVILRAEQLKLSCDVVGQGAFNALNQSGAGIYAQSVSAGGIEAIGGAEGIYASGGLRGFSLEGGEDALKLNGPAALTIFGTADLLDAILEDTAAMADTVWDEVLTGATHNIPTSAGRRLRLVEDVTVLSDGTARGGTAITIQLEAGESTDDEWYKNTLVVLTSETGAKQVRHVESYDGATQTITIDRPWITEPDDTTKYTIKSWSQVHTHLLDANAIAANAFAADVFVDTPFSFLDVGISTRATPSDVNIAVLPMVGDRVPTRLGIVFKVFEDSTETIAWHLVDSNKDDIDLTDATLSFEVYKKDGTLSFQKTSPDGGITIVEALEGQINITIDDSDVETAGNYNYELWMVKSGEKTCLFQDDFQVLSVKGPQP